MNEILREGDIFMLAVDYMITARCNLQCPFCYGPDPDMPGELTTEEKLEFVKGIHRRGAQHLIIAGGEPLISPDIEPVVKQASKIGLRIALQSNVFAGKRLEAVMPHLDWLAVPIDGVSEKSLQRLRTSENQTKRSQQAILASRQINPSIKIKIGTVITPQNVGEIEQIFKCVEELEPDIWKIYQVRPRGAAKNNYASLYLDRSSIEEALSPYIERAKFPTFVSYIENSTFAYLIVNPDSQALSPITDAYLEGSYLVDRQRGTFNNDAWDAVVSEIDMSAHSANMRQSFPGWGF